jgi:hypothetical protein
MKKIIGYSIVSCYAIILIIALIKWLSDQLMISLVELVIKIVVYIILFGLFVLGVALIDSD